MKEKIFEFGLERTLTESGRKTLSRVVAAHAKKFKSPIHFGWDESDDHLLHITTHPVKWEMVFSGRRATVYGSIPFMIRMLFTESKRSMLRDGISQMLEEAGFMEKRAAAAAESPRTALGSGRRSPKKPTG